MARIVRGRAYGQAAGERRAVGGGGASGAAPPAEGPAKPGRARVPDRACLTGIVFVLNTGIQWEYLPQEMGCGSGMTCWRRLRAWQRAGVWDRLHRVLLQRLADAGRIDWSRASADAARLPAKGGGRPVRARDTVRQRAAMPGVRCGLSRKSLADCPHHAVPLASGPRVGQAPT
jgi:transposase